MLGRLSHQGQVALLKTLRRAEGAPEEAPAPAPKQEEQKIRYAGEIFEEPKTTTISDYRNRIAKVGYLGLARDGL